MNGRLNDKVAEGSVPEAEALGAFMTKHFGEAFAAAPSKSTVVGELLQRNRDFLGERRPRIALVGPTFCGKSSIFNTIFGKQLQAISEGPPDTTAYVAEIQLGGVLLYDTPGVGGNVDRHERLTRRFIGLTRSAKAANIEIQMRVYGDPKASPFKKHFRGMTKKHDAEVNEDFWEGQVVVGQDWSPRFDLILVCFSLADTVERRVTSLYRSVRRLHPKVVLLGTKRDRAESGEHVAKLQEYSKRQLGTTFLEVSTRPNYEGTIRALVERFFSDLPESSLNILNSQLAASYSKERQRLLETLIRRVAAKVAVERVDRSVDELNVPVLQAALFGITLKMVLDFGIGGSKVQSSLEAHVRDLSALVATERTERSTQVSYKQVPRRVARKRIEIVPERQSRRVPREREIIVDDAVPGGLSGGALGGLIGALGGPIGVLFGLLGGSLFGWALGGSRRRRERVTVDEIVTEIVMVPREVIEYDTLIDQVPEETTTRTPLSGGSRAAMAVICYGIALYEQLRHGEHDRSQFIDTNAFEERLRALLMALTPSLSDETKNRLDRAKDEGDAFALLEPIFPLPFDGV